MKCFVIYPHDYSKELEKLLKNHKSPLCETEFETAHKKIESDPVTPHIWKIGAKGFYIYSIRRTNPEFRIIYYHCPCNCLNEQSETNVCQYAEPDDAHTSCQCKGLVYYLRVNTREQMNNIYKTEMRIAIRKIEKLLKNK